jgi:hypothetical protein
MRDGGTDLAPYTAGVWQYTVNRMSSTVDMTSLGSPFLSRDGARFARVERHLLLGTVALIATVVLIDHVGSPAGYASFVIAAAFAVRSFARAVDAGFGHYYGWVYGEPNMATRADRVAFRVIHRHRYREREGPYLARSASDLRSGGPAAVDEPKIRILDP